jgi:hypothetical protein
MGLVVSMATRESLAPLAVAKTTTQTLLARPMDADFDSL